MKLEGPFPFPSGEQKLVNIDGRSSYVLNGDSDLEGDDVLPKLLANGWRLIKLFLDEEGGYVLIEKQKVGK